MKGYEKATLKFTFKKIMKADGIDLLNIEETYQMIRNACEQNFKGYTPEQLDSFLREQFEKTQHVREHLVIPNNLDTIEGESKQVDAG